MSSFVTKRNWQDPPFGIIEMYSIPLKTSIVRGILYMKVNPSIKGCLGSQKSAKYEISREMNTVENLTQQLSCGHTNYKLSFFFLKIVVKKPGFH